MNEYVKVPKLHIAIQWQSTNVAEIGGFITEHIDPNYCVDDNPDPNAIVELVNYYKSRYGIDLFAFSGQHSHYEFMELCQDDPVVAAHMQAGYNTLAINEKEQGLIEKHKVIKYSDPTKFVECIVLEFDDETSRLAIIQWAKIMLGKGYKILYEQVMNRISYYEKIDQQKVDRMTKRLVHGD